MAEHRSAATRMFAANAAMREEVGSSDLLAFLGKRLRQTVIDGTTYYVAEGDTLLDEDQLAIYAFQRQKADEARRAAMTADSAGLGLGSLIDQSSRGLLGMTQDGKLVRWQPGLVLTYRVARETFTTDQRYQLSVKSMKEATQAWEDTCGIRFEYKQNLDGQPGPGPAGALFSVRQIDAGGAFIAAAFFPNDPPVRRRVLIDPSFFGEDLRFDRVGVLRHELGHVLGFRHEHIRSGAPAQCPPESLDGVIDLTKYDPQSVMHYFCGGVGSEALKITELDRNGAQRLYGPPLATTEFIAA
jgi:hypothetical protein